MTMMKMKAMTAMLVVVIGMKVFAFPLPQSSDSFRRDENITESRHLHRYTEDNSTRDVLSSHTTIDLMNNSSNNSWSDSMNNSSSSDLRPFMFVFPVEDVDLQGQSPPVLQSMSFGARCVLPTCSVANLATDLLRGDEMAGSDTSDPYGFGKK